MTVAHAARAAVLSAGVAILAAVGFILTPNPDAPPYPLLSDVTSAPVVTPGERTTSDTDRGGERETLAPSPFPSVTP